MHLHAASPNMGEELRLADSPGAAVLLQRALSDIRSGNARNMVGAAVYNSRSKKWSYIDPSPNSRVNNGASWLAGIMGNASGAASAQYIGLTTDATALAATDVSLPSELATNGLTRAIASYGSYTAPASLNATASYVLSKTFTYTGSSSVVVAKAGLYYTSGTATLCFEDLLSTTATVSASGDQISITWTITI